MTQLKRLLVGDDGSPGADRAIEWACGLAAAVDADVVAMRVIENGDDPAALTETLEQRWAEPSRNSGVACDFRVVTGDPRQVLASEATEPDADVVVIGDTGHWTLAHPRLDSVAGHLAHHSPRPVVVVPGAAGPLHDGHIVVGVDDSRGSEAALKWATVLASQAHAAVDARYFYDPLADSYPHPPEASEWRNIEPQVRRMINRAREPNVDIDLQFRGAHLVQGLLETADEVDAGMIVVGAGGHASFHRLLHGGTAIELLHSSRRPVAVVPHIAHG